MANEIQELMFQLMENASFNNFNGCEVAGDLRQHEAWWEAAMFGKFFYNPLLPLRDLRHGYFNADTLFIVVHEKHLQELLSWADDFWRVDEVSWINYKGETGGNVDFGQAELDAAKMIVIPNKVLLRLWWD